MLESIAISEDSIIMATVTNKKLSPRGSDVALAKIISWLRVNGFTCHIPRHGQIFFQRKNASLGDKCDS